MESGGEAPPEVASLMWHAYSGGNTIVCACWQFELLSICCHESWGWLELLWWIDAQGYGNLISATTP